MNFEERYSIIAQKSIKHLDIEVANKIFKAVNKLKNNPFPFCARRCKNCDEKNVYQLKEENCDVIYEIIFDNKIILVHDVKKKN